MHTHHCVHFSYKIMCLVHDDECFICFVTFVIINGDMGLWIVNAGINLLFGVPRHIPNPVL